MLRPAAEASVAMVFVLSSGNRRELKGKVLMTALFDLTKYARSADAGRLLFSSPCMYAVACFGRSINSTVLKDAEATSAAAYRTPQ